MRKLDGKRTSVLAVLIFVFSTSCGSSIMVPAKKIAEAPADHALVTFARTTSYGGATDFEIWDGETFVGIVDPKTYIQYEATPGNHTFLGFVDDWFYINADLEAGKQYFIIANVSMGVSEIRLVFRPIHANDPEYNKDNIDEWLSTLEPTSLDPNKGKEYAEQRVRYAKSAIENFKSGKNNIDTLRPDEWY